MRNPFVYGVGGVLSADIAVPDHERELDFYSTILTTGDVPLWRDDLMNNIGTPIIGLGARTPEYDMLPLQWMPHFQVADIAASAQSAIDMGGNEIMHGKSDDGQSQWAVLTDQVGAAFGLIPVVTEASGDVHNDKHHGRIAWLSLHSPDTRASRDFYQRVVGWNAKQNESNSSEGKVDSIEMLIDDETSAAEIIRSDDENATVPPVWIIHLPVGDLSKSLEQVVERGGSVIEQNTENQFAIIRDPVGVFLALQSNEI